MDAVAHQPTNVAVLAAREFLIFAELALLIKLIRQTCTRTHISARAKTKGTPKLSPFSVRCPSVDALLLRKLHVLPRYVAEIINVFLSPSLICIFVNVFTLYRIGWTCLEWNLYGGKGSLDIWSCAIWGDPLIFYNVIWSLICMLLKRWMNRDKN